MIYDLHSHSYYSDGKLRPSDLVARAIEQGVNVLSLTDHDTVLGIVEAQQAAKGTELKLIPGIEFSCTWNYKTIHIVGLNIDPNNAQLLNAIETLKIRRETRAKLITQKLTKFGIPGVEEGVAQQIKGVPGRLHYARYLVERGYASTPGKAFKKFMAKGKPGYVPTEWLSLSDTVDIIKCAGGLSIIAHPRRYDLTFKRLTKLAQEFADLGGDGIEVATSSQGKEDQALLASLARQLSLYASIGSDFHEPCVYNELGKARFLVDIDKNINSLLQVS